MDLFVYGTPGDLAIRSAAQPAWLLAHRRTWQVGIDAPVSCRCAACGGSPPRVRALGVTPDPHHEVFGGLLQVSQEEILGIDEHQGGYERAQALVRTGRGSRPAVIYRPRPARCLDPSDPAPIPAQMLQAALRAHRELDPAGDWAFLGTTRPSLAPLAAVGRPDGAPCRCR